MSSTRSLSNREVVRAALVVLVGFLASGLLGFVRTAVISAQFGAGAELDAFFAAQRIPEVLFTLVAGGALGSSFIPIYAHFRQQDEAQAWRMASATITLASLAALILGGLVALIAPWLVKTILLSASSPAMQDLTAQMIRMMMVTPAIFAISGLLMGILQSHGLFLLPSLAISMNNIGLMIGALVLAPLMAAFPYGLPEISLSAAGLPVFWSSPVDQVGPNSVYGLAWGAVLSAVLHLTIQLPGLRGLGARLRPLADWRVPGVREVLRLMGPRVLGLAVVQANFVVNIILTDGMVEGSLVALNIAFTLMFFALGLIGQSVGSAVFPTLSALYAAGDMAGFKDRLASAMRIMLFLSFPATAAFILLGEPIVSLFERGIWGPESTAATAWALSFYALGIAGFALLELLSRAFYALADTWTPVLIGIGAMASNIVLSLILIQFIGDPGDLTRGPFAGLALANAVTTLLESLLLWVLLSRRIGRAGGPAGIDDRRILDGAWRSLVAALLMSAALWGVRQALPVNFGTAIIGMAVGGVVFFGAAIVLGLDEARAVPSILLRRFRR